MLSGVAFTGILAEVLRVAEAGMSMYVVYFVHLVLIFSLFLYAPYLQVRAPGLPHRRARGDGAAGEGGVKRTVKRARHGRHDEVRPRTQEER